MESDFPQRKQGRSFSVFKSLSLKSHALSLPPACHIQSRRGLYKVHEIQEARVFGGHLRGWPSQDLFSRGLDGPRAGKYIRLHSDIWATKWIQSGSNRRMQSHLEKHKGTQSKSPWISGPAVHRIRKVLCFTELGEEWSWEVWGTPLDVAPQEDVVMLLEVITKSVTVFSKMWGRKKTPVFEN